MTPDISTTRSINTSLLIKRMLLGGAIALAVISLFVFGGEANPAWPAFWRIRPLIITPLAGAAGGACYYFIDQHLLNQPGWKKGLAIVLSILVYFIGLWMGIVLGLDGTMWD